MSPPAPVREGPDPVGGPSGQECRYRPVPGLRYWSRKDVPLASMWPQRSQERQDDAILFVRRARSSGSRRRPASTPTRWSWTPQPQVGADLVADRRSCLSGRPRDRPIALGGGVKGQALQGRGAVGRLSPTSWSRTPNGSMWSAGISRSPSVESRAALSVRSLGFPSLPSGLQPEHRRQPRRRVRAGGADGPTARSRMPNRSQGASFPRPARPGRDPQLVRAPDRPWPRSRLQPGLGRRGHGRLIAETNNKDDWASSGPSGPTAGPTAVLNESDVPLATSATTSPSTPLPRLRVTVPSSIGASLWIINRQEKKVNSLTFSAANAFDSDPSFASR